MARGDTGRNESKESAGVRRAAGTDIRRFLCWDDSATLSVD